METAKFSESENNIKGDNISATVELSLCLELTSGDLSRATFPFFKTEDNKAAEVR